MSAIISAIPANALLPVAGALVGWVGHMAWHHAERAHVARGMALIRRFMDGNDDWADAHKARFALTADPDVTGEVLHVEHATGEHQLPSIAEGLARLADEVGLVQALSDRPADDEDIVGEEQPGEAWFEGLVRAWHRLRTWLLLWWSRRPDFLKSADQRAVEFWAEPPAADPFERFRIDDNPRGRSATTEAELGAAFAAWSDADTGWQSSPRHASDEQAQDTGYRGSRWAQGIEHTGVFPVVVPAQRSGDADA